ncbi:MAG: hypothetical protein ACT4P4_00630 [Betaproteobacteria bacterium]
MAVDFRMGLPPAHLVEGEHANAAPAHRFLRQAERIQSRRQRFQGKDRFHDVERPYERAAKRLLAAVAMLLAFGILSARAQDRAAEGAPAVSIPLAEQGRWQALQYSSIAPHRIRFSPAGLEIAVEASAMPLIYPLASPVAVRSVRVQGRILEGALLVPPQKQGEKGADDYVLRVGLVEPGGRTLNFLQRQVAAAWVRKLFELAPPGGGISRIHFLNVGAEKAHLGRQRVHPLSELLVEKVVALPRQDGRFDFTHVLERPLQALAGWLSADGDDTQSRYRLLVEAIELLP